MNVAVDGSIRDSRIYILGDCSHMSINSHIVSGVNNKMLTDTFFSGIMKFTTLIKALMFLAYKKGEKL